MARLFAASLTTSPLPLLPWGHKHFSANLSYSSNKHGLGPTTCYIKLFHPQTTLYMSRWFVTSLPTLPLSIVLPLGLYTSPQPSLSLKQALTWSRNPHPASMVSFSTFCTIQRQVVLGHPLFCCSFCGQILITLPLKWKLFGRTFA